MSVLEKATELLKAQLGESLQAVETFRGETTVVVDRERIVDACRLLSTHEELSFDRLVNLTAVDHWPKEPRFRIVYHLYSMTHAAYLGLQVPISGEDPKLASLEPVFFSANWHEREIYDMFGVTFTGSSDLRRILMPADWVGHPLRKDYPLGYEEVQFSFNYDQINRQKKYAKE